MGSLETPTSLSYFLLRMSAIGRSIGTLATNTVSQGDTREVGLDQILGSGRTLHRAIKSEPWPNDATLEIAKLWIWDTGWKGNVSLDGSAVDGITVQLTAESRSLGQPARLARNTGQAFIGSLVNGIGFVLEAQEADELLRADPSRVVRLPWYLNGADLNKSPEQRASRRVINFGTATEAEARADPELFQLVLDRVKPARDKLPASKARVRDRYWQFEFVAPALHEATKGMSQMVAVAARQPHLCSRLHPVRSASLGAGGGFRLRRRG